MAFLLKDTVSQNYREIRVLYAYWALWIVMQVLFLIGHYKNQICLIRAAYILVLIRNIFPLYNFENRKTFDDLAARIQFT